MTKEVAAQVQITSTFNQQAASAIGDYADKQRIAVIALRTQADQEPDPAKQAQLRESAQTLENNWGPNGTLRIAAQGVVAGLTGGLPGALGAASGAVAAPAIADALAAAHIEGPLASALTAAASAAIGGLVGGSVGASTSVNEVVNNYLQHSTHWRSSQWGAFKEELARCQATSGCNVDGVYQRWTAIGNDQQKAAMSSMDAMLGADPSAAAEAGKSFGAAAAAMSVSPADVCPPGDARCAGFVGQQNNQAAAILRAGLVVAYANDRVEGGGRPNAELKNNNADQLKSGANGAVNPTPLNELTSNGVKFTPENVIAATRNVSGKIVFLETGNSTAGLRHIVQEHGSEFANIGVPGLQIPRVVMRAIEAGRSSATNDAEPDAQSMKSW